jgi:hypothetical protein
MIGGLVESVTHKVRTPDLSRKEERSTVVSMHVALTPFGPG